MMENGAKPVDEMITLEEQIEYMREVVADNCFALPDGLPVNPIECGYGKAILATLEACKSMNEHPTSCRCSYCEYVLRNQK